MKKVFSILMVAFALTAMVACGDKTEGTGNGGGNNNGGGTPDPGTEQTDALAETEWSYFEGDELMLDPYRYVDVIFGKHHSIVYGDNNHLNEPAVRVSAYGTYTYDEATGTGTATLKDQDDDHTLGTATFTVNGEEMEFSFNGETFSMRKVEY